MPIAQRERERGSLFVFVLEAQLGLLFSGQPGGAARCHPCSLRRLAARTVESTARFRAAWEGK